MKEIEVLQEIIDKASSIVVFTGAGISVGSGIPDFRSADGIYNQKTKIKASPEEIISHSFFTRHTEDFYDFYKEKMVYPNAKPNVAHEYFAKLEKRGKNVIIVTQNIDGLHQKAGNTMVYELHGSVHRNYCMDCDRYFGSQYVMNYKGVPHCDKCGGIIKPDVVLYEEALDDDTVSRAISAIMTCEVLIVVGTSLTVYPAAGFIRYFKGKSLVVINKDKTNYDNYCDLVINDDVCKVVKELK